MDQRFLRWKTRWAGDRRRGNGVEEADRRAEILHILYKPAVSAQTWYNAPRRQPDNALVAPRYCRRRDARVGCATLLRTGVCVYRGRASQQRHHNILDSLSPRLYLSLILWTLVRRRGVYGEPLARTRFYRSSVEDCFAASTVAPHLKARNGVKPRQRSASLHTLHTSLKHSSNTNAADA